MLREALRCPVEIFDPFQNVDLSGLTEAELDELDQNRSESVVALGLAAGAIDDSLYSLEILPEAVKRRQRFLQRTVFNLLAAAAAVIVLVLYGLQQKDHLAAMVKHGKRLMSIKNGVVRDHQATEALAKLNQLQAGVADLLTERSLPLDGTVHVMRAMEECMEPEFWLKTIRIVRREAKDGTRGRKSRSVVEVVGIGKESSGRGVSVAYEQMVARLKARPDVGVVTQRDIEHKRDRWQFTLEFDFLAKAEPKKKPAEKEGN